MRLYEISSLTKDQFTPQHRESPKEVGVDFGQKDQKEIGKGMFAEVFSTPQEPGTVRKISTVPVNNLKQDSYFQYVSMIAKNDRMSSNPYFPKVFNIQVRSFPRKGVDDDNLGIEYVYAADIERLALFTTLSNSEARMLGNKIFYDFEKRDRGARTKEYKSPKIQWRFRLINLIEETFYGTGMHLKSHPLVTIIKDRYYKQAILLIRKMVLDNDRMRQDMHEGNIMIRRGPGGPQLVFTDPVM